MVAGSHITRELMASILDSLKDPVLFIDTDHVMQYMNKAAIAHFEEGERLLGRSVMECHNERSRKIILETLPMLEAGAEERLISDTAEQRIYMRAVRDPDGAVLGYYERYASPQTRHSEGAGGVPEESTERC